MTDRLTLAEAAELAGCSVKTLRRRIKDGSLEAELVNGSYLVREADVRQVLRVPEVVSSGSWERVEDPPRQLAADSISLEAFQELRRQNSDLLQVVLQLHGQLDESRKALTAGHEQASARELELSAKEMDLRERAARLEAELTAARERSTLLQAELEKTEEQLELERRRTWWRRLTGRS